MVPTSGEHDSVLTQQRAVKSLLSGHDYDNGAFPGVKRDIDLIRIDLILATATPEPI
jgi:hypothetical protein